MAAANGEPLRPHHLVTTAKPLCPCDTCHYIVAASGSEQLFRVNGGQAREGGHGNAGFVEPSLAPSYRQRTRSLS
jgi:hypothetical protein